MLVKGHILCALGRMLVPQEACWGPGPWGSATSLLQHVSVCDSPSDPGLFQPSRPALHDVLHPQRPHLVSIVSFVNQLLGSELTS